MTVHKRGRLSPDTVARLNRWQAWGWWVSLAPYCAAFFVMSVDAFARMTLLFLGVATIVTAAVSAQVAARQAQDADVQEVLDEVKTLEDEYVHPAGRRPAS